MGFAEIYTSSFDVTRGRARLTWETIGPSIPCGDRPNHFALGQTVSLRFQEEQDLMSAPSRRPEIRRRRIRREKIAKLKKRYAAASSEAERSRIAAKLQRQALASPGNPLLKNP
jgi:hypothetical protein